MCLLRFFYPATHEFISKQKFKVKYEKSTNENNQYIFLQLHTHKHNLYNRSAWLIWSSKSLTWSSCCPTHCLPRGRQGETPLQSSRIMSTSAWSGARYVCAEDSVVTSAIAHVNHGIRIELSRYWPFLGAATVIDQPWQVKKFFSVVCRCCGVRTVQWPTPRLILTMAPGWTWPLGCSLHPSPAATTSR